MDDFNLSEISEYGYLTIFVGIGFVVAQWSFVELAIDSIVALIFHKGGEKNIAHRNQIPRSLKSKIDFLKKSFNNIHMLSPFTQEALLLLDRVIILSKDRHDLVHSCVSGTSLNSFSFHKFDYTEHFHKPRKIKFTSDDFLQSGKKMLRLGKDLGNFWNRLRGFLLP